MSGRKVTGEAMEGVETGAVVGGIAVAGLFGLLMILVWQLLATWRTKIGASREINREEAYQSLSAEMASLQSQTVSQMADTEAQLAALRASTDEIARLLKEVG